MHGGVNEISFTVPRQEAQAFRIWYREQSLLMDQELNRISEHFCRKVDRLDLMAFVRARLGASLLLIIQTTLIGDESTTYPVHASGLHLQEFHELIARINKAWEGQLRFVFTRSERTNPRIRLERCS